jgi:hypothetical protein
MPGSKSRQVGTAGLVSRHRDGTCTHTCRRCQHWEAFSGWRTALRAARAHAADYHAAQTRYLPTPTGITALGATRRAPRRRVVAVVIVVLLAALSLTVADLASRAGSAPAPTTPQAPYQHTPVPAGPPASSSAGGDR